MMQGNQAVSPQNDKQNMGNDNQQQILAQNQGQNPRQYLNNMLEGYQQNMTKKAGRGGSRGVTS